MAGRDDSPEGGGEARSPQGGPRASDRLGQRNDGEDRPQGRGKSRSDRRPHATRGGVRQPPDQRRGGGRNRQLVSGATSVQLGPARLDEGLHWPRAPQGLRRLAVYT